MISRVYSGLLDSMLALRHRAYDSGLLKSCRSEVPVLSVGSISIGGAGKTPLSLLLTGEFLKRGLRPALLSRGYGRAVKGLQVFPPGGLLHENAVAFGDEAAIFRRHFPELAIVLSGDRCRGVKYIEKHIPADLIILDDGFQHRRLKHDADILVFKRSFRGRDEAYFPFGRLRDRFDRLSEADMIFYEKGISPAVAGAFVELAPCVEFRIEYSLSEPSELRGKIAAFSGLADNRAFQQSLEKIGIHPENLQEFPDHAIYGKKNIGKLDALSVDHFICTEKDLVKLPPEFTTSRDLRVLEMRIVIEKTEDFISQIRERIKI